jgi:polar amino acid transport system permease protein
VPPSDLTPASGGGSAPTRHRLKRRTRAKVQRWSVYAITLLVLAAIIAKVDWPKVQTAFFDWDIFIDLFPKIITVAAKNTLIFAFFGFAGGLIIGLGIALMRLSSIRPYRWFAVVYIEIFRGIPAIVTLILIGFALPIALGVRVPFTYGPGSLALALVSGAYLAETIRSGIEAVPKGQMEAARSLGMSPGRSMASIVIPQAFRIILPPLTNEFVLLLKDTSLIFVLGVTEETIELSKFGRDAVGRTFNATPLIAVALIYLIITIPLTRAVAVLERRAKKAR